MNGFEILADAYRKSGNEKNAKVLDFLANCDEEDICNMFDSTAFNEIAKAYMRQTVKELIGEGTITEDQGQEIRNRFSLLFNEKRAGEILKTVP